MMLPFFLASLLACIVNRLIKDRIRCQTFWLLLDYQGKNRLLSLGWVVLVALQEKEKSKIMDRKREKGGNLCQLICSDCRPLVSFMAPATTGAIASTVYCCRAKRETSIRAASRLFFGTLQSRYYSKKKQKKNTTINEICVNVAVFIMMLVQKVSGGFVGQRIKPREHVVFLIGGAG